jgi:hypothetical protein
MAPIDKSFGQHDSDHDPNLEDQETVLPGAHWALALGAAVVAMTAAGGAVAEVRPIDLDGCSSGCNSNAMDALTAAPDGTESKVALWLCGGSPTSGALLFDPEAVPTVLASGLPSALSPDPGKKPGAQIGSTFVDFEYVFTHPEELTWGDILSDSNAYFAAQSQAVFPGPAPLGLDVGVNPNYSPPARFSTGDIEASPKKATRPAWMDWTLPVSQ